MSAPERVWLEYDENGISSPGMSWAKPYEESYVEYVRADLLDEARSHCAALRREVDFAESWTFPWEAATPEGE